MRKNKEKILLLTLLCFFSVSTMFLPDVVASHTTVGTLNYLETKLFQINGNVTLLFNNSATGHQDITLVNLGYVTSTNKTVVQARSNNITYDWSFVNNTKAYNYIDVFSNNTYTINVNYQSIVVPKSPVKILQEMLTAKNLTLAKMTGNATNLTKSLTSMKRNWTMLKNENINISELMNETAANNTPLHMEIMDLSAEIDRLNSDILSKNNAIIMGKTQIDDYNDTINDLANTWSTGYTRNGVGYFYVNIASMMIAAILCVLVFVIFTYRSKIKEKGKDTLKGTMKTTTQDNQDTSGFMDAEVKDTETNFLANEKLAEAEDVIADIKKKDPEVYQKFKEKREKTDTQETPPAKTQVKEVKPLKNTIDFKE